MRLRLSLGAAIGLGVLCALSLLLQCEVPVTAAASATQAQKARGSRRQKAGPQRYVYEYYTEKFYSFPMLSLGTRADPACPGGPASPPYVTVIYAGRLGNAILEYAAAWALARMYGLPAFVPDSLLRRLQTVFMGLSLRDAQTVVGGDAACQAAAGGSKADGSGAAAKMQKWRPWKALSHVDLRRVPLADAVQTARQQRAFIVLDVCSQLPAAVVQLARELRKELRFQPPLRKYAQAQLHRLRKKYFPKFNGEVVYGAVHARRTDYHGPRGLLMNVYNVSRPVGEAFFVAAAKWLRRGLQPHQRLLLVACSDDAPWAQRKLVPALSAAGKAKRVGKGWAAAWAGNGDTLRPEHDLALLSACNHTIYAYGTFGLSAALAAGGRTAVYQLARTPLHPKLLTPSEQFARNIPGWVVLRGDSSSPQP